MLLLFALRHFAFETAIGVNGAVWLRAGSPLEGIVIRNAILNAELLNGAQTLAMVRSVPCCSLPFHVLTY